MLPAIACALVLVLAAPAQAQLNGSHTPRYSLSGRT